jgi:hypothetical protein
MTTKNDKLKFEKVKMFNQILESMVIQFSPLIGTTFHYKLTSLLKVNAMLPIKEFLLQSMPIKDKILNRDETYFEKDEARETLVDVTKDDMNDILKLQGVYCKLDKQSKNNCWDIFQALLILACEYNDLC